MILIANILLKITYIEHDTSYYQFHEKLHMLKSDAKLRGRFLFLPSPEAGSDGSPCVPGVSGSITMKPLLPDIVNIKMSPF